MARRLLFVSAGHSSVKGKDNGAVAIDGRTEGQLTEEFRNLFVAECKALGITCNVDGANSVLSDTINLFKKYTNKDSILIEFHFNAGPASATGTEVLVPSRKEYTDIEVELGRALSQKASEVLGIPNRGFKTEEESARGRLGWMRLTGHNILPEICFISNKFNLSMYDIKKKELAKAWALIIKEYINI